MATSGPEVFFADAEVAKFKQILQAKTKEDKQYLFNQLNSQEKSRCIQWGKLVIKPHADKMRETERRIDDSKSKLTQIDKNIEAIQAQKRSVFVQYGQKVSSDIEKATQKSSSPNSRLKVQY